MEGQNPYGTLGFDSDASASDISASDIRKAYKKLVLKHHPDKGGDTEEFQKIQKAYTVLWENAEPEPETAVPEGRGATTDSYYPEKAAKEAEAAEEQRKLVVTELLRKAQEEMAREDYNTAAGHLRNALYLNSENSKIDSKIDSEISKK